MMHATFLLLLALLVIFFNYDTEVSAVELKLKPGGRCYG